jgi:60 kDa SS-A/Ro ribonucleoprotein
MAVNYSSFQDSKQTPQSQPIPGREKEMAKNNAGGYTFVLDKWKMLQRFLVLGSEGGTYYVTQNDLTKLNISNCLACIDEDPKRVLETIVEISDSGRAAKNDQAIFLLAALITNCKDSSFKTEISKAMPKICRTGTHLFMFTHYVDTMRSWGRSVRKAISNWYAMEPSKLEYQLVKYQGRTVEGTGNQWTHRDVLRSAHVKPVSDAHNELFKYAVKGEKSEALKLINAFDELKTADVAKAKKLIKEYKIPQDAWPTELKNNVSIWTEALDDIPLTALMRSLNRLTAIGVIGPGKFNEIERVVGKLTNQDYISKSRLHPLNILIALKTYSMGHGIKGSLTWKPVGKVRDALEEAFYLSFKNIEPTDKRFLLALDVSGSMGGAYISGAYGIVTCREASACMAMVTARTEKNYEIMGFSSRFMHLDITPRMSLNETIRKISGLPFEGTDCALPMEWALREKLDFDIFTIYTDNETWAGRIAPSQALKKYRNAHVKDAKLAVVGMVGTQFTIADPKDPGMLDVCGFDSAAPSIISEFAKGGI